MKKLILGALALAALLPIAAEAQEYRKTATLAYAFDLDGEAADADQVIVATAIVDSGTSVGDVNWTIVAQPDVCRLLNLTVVDTDMTAGVLTVTGYGCLQEPKTCTFTFTAGDDTGVKNLSCVGGEDAYFTTVSTVTTGVMTGESDETFALGYAGVNSVNGWPMYGKVTPTGPNGEEGVDPFDSYPVAQLITTAGLSGTNVAGVNAADAPFAGVAAGDLLLIKVGGREYERKVVTWGSADQVVLNKAITIPSAGVTFRYKKAFFSTNPADEMVLPVAGYDSLLVNWSVDANANTGGVITLFQCTDAKQPDWPSTPWVQISTTTVNSAATQIPTAEAVDLNAKPYTFCRFGMRFGTNDDDDGAADEDINLSVTLRKK